MTNTFLRVALGTIALAALGGAAQAADMYRKAPPATPIMEVAPVSVYNWTGFYAGANIGGEFLRDNAVAGGIREKLNGGSVFGGVQAGYNWQTGPFVLGAEADIGYGRASKTKAFGLNTMKVEQGFSGTVRARAGYAIDRALVYGTGGFAWSRFATTVDDGVTAVKSTRTRPGWVVGGGVEYAMTNNISLKGEYLYENFGRANKTINAVPTSNSLTDHIVRVGVNYKF